MEKKQFTIKTNIMYVENDQNTQKYELNENQTQWKKLNAMKKSIF